MQNIPEIVSSTGMGATPGTLQPALCTCTCMIDACKNVCTYMLVRSEGHRDLNTRSEGPSKRHAIHHATHQLEVSCRYPAQALGQLDSS